MKTLNNNKQIRNSTILFLFIFLMSISGAFAQRRTVSVDNGSEKNETRTYRSPEKNSNRKHDAAYNDKRKNEQGKKHYNGNRYAEHKDKKSHDSYHGHWKYDNRNYNGWQSTVHIEIDPYRDYHPHHHVAFRKIPRKAIWVQLDGNYYVTIKGRFYQPGPMGYYRVKPPRYIKHLPDGCQVVWTNGQQFFQLHGILFLNTPMGFKVIV